MTAAPRCSAESARVEEPVAGTAPQALAWVALEQRGPWGARAATESHLPAALGRAVEAVAADHDSRFCLVRRPGRHEDTRVAAPRRLLVTFTAPGATWLLRTDLEEPEALLGLDWAGLRAGDRDAVAARLPGSPAAGGASGEAEPQLLVCTNGTRDLCCAVVGRPVALAAAAVRTGRVWEVTHTSGHRFAPTAVLLPAGVLHGRLDGAGAVAVLDAAGRGETVLAGNRGRSTWAPAGQVAELAVRRHTGELSLDALTVTRSTPDESRVDHRDGRAWRVRTETSEGAAPRPESCGRPALPPMATVATAVVRVDGPPETGPPQGAAS